MSQAASQAAVFYRDLARARRVWTLRDANGVPAPATPEGRAMPFWSSRSRVERIIATVPAFAGFEPFEISWDEFHDKWLPGLSRDDILVGLNWSGPRGTGYDVDPETVRAAAEAMIRPASPQH